MTIVMGLDQHRAQITAEWIDTTTGEIARARVAPAHREPVRRFVARFGGHKFEVALEATKRWRSVVEEPVRPESECTWRVRAPPRRGALAQSVDAHSESS